MVELLIIQQKLKWLGVRVIMMKKIKLCLTTEVPEVKPKCIQTEDDYFAVYRHDKNFVVIRDVCPHQMGSFETSPNENGTITCAFHGWRFRLEDGCVVRGYKNLTKFPVTIVHNEIWIDYTKEEESDNSYQSSFTIETNQGKLNQKLKKD